jgi:hypothetical protein
LTEWTRTPSNGTVCDIKSKAKANCRPFRANYAVGTVKSQESARKTGRIVTWHVSSERRKPGPKERAISVHKELSTRLDQKLRDHRMPLAGTQLLTLLL